MALGMVLGAAGAALGKTALGTAGAIGQNALNNRQQFKQQQKLQAMQIAGAKELGEFNQGLALDTWEKTNYNAQRNQLQKAGLNVGLMYQGGGQGGTTSGGSAQMPTGATAQNMPDVGMAMQQIMNLKLGKAQKENIEADTNKKKVETEKTAGVDTEAVKSSIELMKQQTENTDLQGDVIYYEGKLKQVEARIATRTEEELVAQTRNLNYKLEEEITNARTENRIKKETADEVINQIRTATKEQELRIRTQKQGLIKGDADIKKVNAELAAITQEMQIAISRNNIEWARLNQSERETIVKEILGRNSQRQTEFNTSTPAHIRQWTEILGGLVSTAAMAK